MKQSATPLHSPDGTDCMYCHGLLGCATSGDLAKVRDQQNQIAAKADQALQEAQSAKANHQKHNKQNP